MNDPIQVAFARTADMVVLEVRGKGIEHYAHVTAEDARIMAGNLKRLADAVERRDEKS